MQAVQAGLSSAAFANANLGSAGVVRSRDTLLLKALEHAPADGLVCEFGVYKGRTLSIIAKALSNRRVYGFDSFGGLPEAWRSGFGKGAFRVELSDVPVLPENVKLYAGLFDATLPTMLQEDSRPAAFLHIDCDLYSSTKCVFGALSERLRTGTVIVFDEYYNFPGWEKDEHRALLEAAQGSGFTYKYLFYNPNGQQVAIVVTGVRDP